MSRSKITVFHGKDKPISIDIIQIPELKEGEILIKNEYTTLCRSDLNTYCGKRNEKTPTILGHEVVGRIVDFGPDTSSFDLKGNRLSVQDRITWAIYASDPNTLQSKAGIPQKSPDLFKYGHEQLSESNSLHGGLGEFIILREHTPIIKISEAVPLPVAAIINCAVATVAGAIRSAGTLKGKRVLVSGAGMLGMVACAMARVYEAAKVVAIDVNEDRLKKAKEFGADELYNTRLDKIRSNELFDVVFELSGITSAMQDTLSKLVIGGVAVWVGATYPQPALRINAEEVVRKLLTIKGLHNYNSEDLKEAVNFIELHYQLFPFEKLVEKQFTLEETDAAFRYGIDKNPFRVGIKF